jgi:hypothetical protein
VHSKYIPQDEFRSRIGYCLGDARKLYQTMSRDEGYWTNRVDPTQDFGILVHNCLNEILHGACEEWSRWFSTVSRRGVEDVFMAVCPYAATRMMLDKNSRGNVVTLPLPTKSSILRNQRNQR